MDILKTNTANCKDCHKCIRHCAVNAIKFIDGNAVIDLDKCILDGKCYNICPQKAKSIRNDIDFVRKILISECLKVASIAPSFFAYYPEPEASRIIAALKLLGFDIIEQTSKAAHTVATAHYNYYINSKDIVLTSSCPSAVYLIEKYYPELLKYLAPIDSPMIAHYKILKNELKKPFKMVFIGPCIAKKKEIEESEISACLTFEELEEWIKQENININKLEPIFFKPFYSGNISLFPLLGGLIESAGLKENPLKDEVISISGIENIKTLLNAIQNNKVSSRFIEILACEGGCLNGPAKPCSSSLYELKSNIIKRISSEENNVSAPVLKDSDIKRIYKQYSMACNYVTEEEITNVLVSLGKTTKEDELNCGACGYNSCREKAIAVINGFAEKEMCIPYMKNKAERLYSTLLESNPTGVIILDNNLDIIEANQSFLNIIQLQKSDIISKNISLITSENAYKDILDNKQQIYEVTACINGKKIKKIIYYINEHKLIIGFYVDISDLEAQKEALNKVKAETIDRAQKVVNKQMRVAQEIAGLLGETTAETKVLLGQLIKIMKEE